MYPSSTTDGKSQKVAATDELLQINKNVFEGTNVSEIVRAVRAEYITNTQNHNEHLLSIGGALLVLITGWNFLAGDLISGIIMGALAFLVIAITFRLMLRHKYWIILSNQALLLTEAGIINYFNNGNKRCKYYRKSELPFIDTIIHIAVMQSVFEWNERLNWSRNFLSKIAVKTANLKGIAKDRQMER